MAGKRPQPPSPGWERLVCLLLGACLGLICLGLLGRCQAPAALRAPEESARPRRSVGLELEFRFQVLLPESEDG